MKRGKVEERRYFTREEKEQILAKTNGVCASCGKPLKIGEDFTIEHVIPISKGGTNDMSNLLPLCEVCNKEKDDRIMNPVFYKFAPRDLLEQLMEQQVNYYNNYTWLGRHNFTPADRELMGLAYGKFFNEKGRRAMDRIFVSGACIYEKMTYAMMDEVYNYKCKYLEKLLGHKMTPAGKAFLKVSMDVDFMINSSYVLRKSTGGEIAGVITLSWRKVDIADESCYCLTISKIVMLYPNEANIRRVGITILEICTDILTELHLDSLIFDIHGESGLMFKLQECMHASGAYSYGNGCLRIFKDHYFKNRTDTLYTSEAKILRDTLDKEVAYVEQIRQVFCELYPDFADFWDLILICLSAEDEAATRIEYRYWDDLQALEERRKISQRKGRKS